MDYDSIIEGIRKPMIKISVIVPVYNSEKYLHQCLDSLVNQTLQEIEIILVDDASTDRSSQIMDDYEKRFPEKVKCIHLQYNHQGIEVGKLGFRQAQGTYISVVNDDDYIAIDMMEKLYNKAEESGCKADIVYGDYGVIDEDGIQRGESYPIVLDEFLGSMTPEKRSNLLLCEAYCWGQIVKRQIALDYSFGPWDISVSASRILHVKQVEKVSEKLYFFRQRTESMSRKSNSYALLHNYGNAAMHILLLTQFPDFEPQYSEAIMARFILYFYFNQLKLCATNFDTPPVDYLRYLKDTVHRLYPDYRKNSYLCNLLEPWKLALMDLNDQSPEDYQEKSQSLVASGIHTMGQDLKRGYGGYYRQRFDRFKQLFGYCRKQGRKIALWGLGERGSALLDCYHEEISCIIDNDIRKQGGSKYGITISDFNTVAGTVDVILVTNSGWVSSIKTEIKSLKGPQMLQLVNVEAFLKYPAPLELFLCEVW